MSRILRRPMFRGGPASSDGVGITSGLNDGYATGGRVGFKKGEGFFDFLSPEVVNEDEIQQRINEGTLYPPVKRDASELLYLTGLGRLGGIGQGALKTAGKYPQVLDQYKRYVSGIKDPFVGGESMIVNAPGNITRPGMFTNAAIKEAVSPYVSGALGVGRSVYDKIKDYGLAIAGAGGLGYGGYKTYKNLTGGDKNKQDNKFNNQDDQDNQDNKDTTTLSQQPVKNDVKTIYEDLLPLFKEHLGPNSDEYTRQKYLELAKFGLNLLKPTPVGIKPSLMGSISSAAEKPLEGYQNILSREAQAEMVPKQLAMQAALSQAQLGQYGKNLKDLMNLGYTRDQALGILTKADSAAMQKEMELRVNDLSTKLADLPSFKENKTIKQNPLILDQLAETIIKYKLPRGAITKILPENKADRKTGEFYFDPNTGAAGKYKNGRLYLPGEAGY
jgi:hypothetical protein